MGAWKREKSSPLPNTFLALRRLASRNFAHTNFNNEAHTLRLARHRKANSLIRNLPNEIEHVLTKTEDETSISGTTGVHGVCSP
jgi:hypothetical protein